MASTLILDREVTRKFIERLLLPPKNTGERGMGLVFANITLTNFTDKDLVNRGVLQPTQIRSVQARALVDSGAIISVIPETIRAQLGLTVFEERHYELADGSERKLQVVGPLEIKFENRTVIGSAVVMGDDVLLGVTALEEMDIMIDPKNNRLVVNPNSPNMARLLLK